jgi:hypothetical protein
MNLSARVPSVLLAALVLGVPACSSGPRTYPVKGRITYNGKPVPTGTVQFMPVNAGPMATGEINQDGTYTLTTDKRGGACAGKYRVVVMAFPPRENMTPYDNFESIIPPKYSSLAFTDLKATVEERDNVCDFTLVGETKMRGATEAPAKEKDRHPRP